MKGQEKKLYLLNFLKIDKTVLIFELYISLSLIKILCKKRYDKNNKLNCYKLFDISWKKDHRIREINLHYWIFELIILNLESCFTFIIFFYPYLIMSIYEIKL